jgi:hypothetical protein
MDDGLMARKRAPHTPRAMVIAPATLAKEIADRRDYRDGRQYYCASPCDATAPFTLARQQKGEDCAGRHFAAAASVVSVAKLPRFWLDRLQGLEDDIAGLVLPVSKEC